MKNDIIMHINYAEVKYATLALESVDAVCKMAANIGFDGIEFRGEVCKGLEPLSFREYVEQVAAAKKKYGLKQVLFALGMKDCTNADVEVREKCIADTIERAKMVREICETEVCNTSASWISSTIPTAPKPGYEFNGSAAASAEQWEMTVDAYRRVAVDLEKIDLRLAFETHMSYIHDLPAMAMKLVDLIDSPFIGINMDYGNTVYFPSRPTLQDTIDLYGEKLFYTHLKNSVATPGSGLRLPTALSEGEINHRAYLKKLKDIGFTGPIGVEAPRPGDRVHYAKNDLAYVKELIEELK